jgi:hypothetical protein
MILHRRVNTSELHTECVSWPIPTNHTKAGCEVGGNALHDGGTYHYNTGRGTDASVCAKQPHPNNQKTCRGLKTCRGHGVCAICCECCRTGADTMQLNSYTFAMEVSL